MFIWRVYTRFFSSQVHQVCTELSVSLWDMSRELEGQEGVRSHTTVVFADRGSTESDVTEVGLF